MVAAAMEIRWELVAARVGRWFWCSVSRMVLSLLRIRRRPLYNCWSGGPSGVNESNTSAGTSTHAHTLHYLALCWLWCTSNCLASSTKLRISRVGWFPSMFRLFSCKNTLNKGFRVLLHSLIISGNIGVIFLEIPGLSGLNNSVMSVKNTLSYTRRILVLLQEAASASPS